MTSTLEVRRLAKFVGKVRRCCCLLTFVDKESELEVISLPCLQPVQLAEEWADMAINISKCSALYQEYKIVIRNIAMFKYSLHKFRETILHRKYQLF